MIQNPDTPPVVMAEAAVERSLDLRAYVGVLSRYKWAILSLALLAGIIGMYMAVKAVPVYGASAKLQIERNNQNAIMGAQFGAFWFDMEFYETQYQLIRSWGVAELAAEKLGLFDALAADPVEAEPAQAADPGLAGFSWRDLLPQGFRSNPVALSAEERRANIIAGVQARIEVEPVEKSQLAAIRISGTDPVRAAEYANVVAESYVEFLKDKNLENIQNDQNWYTSRMDKAKEDLDAANLALQRFYERQGLLQSTGDANTLQTQRLQSALTGQTEAQATRQDLERVYRDIVNARNGQGSLETITELENRGVVRTLKSAVVAARQEVTRLAQRYGPRHPAMITAQTAFENNEMEFTAELERVADSVVTDYRRAQSAEQGFTRQVEAAKEEVRVLDRNRAEQQRLEDAVVTSKAIFEKLQSGEQTSVMLGGGSQKPNVTIIEHARANYSPIRPNKQRMVLTAAMVGLMLGVGLAFLLNHLDNTFKGPEDVERRLALPVLGSLPKLKPDKENRLQPMREFEQTRKSAFSEAVRTIRTGVMLGGLDRDRNVVMVTSSVPGEGKTTLSLNLAYAIGTMKSVLLVDADMRRPMVGKAHDMERTQPGLASLVSGEAAFEECVTRPEGSDLTIIHAGKVPPNPLELLSSRRFEEMLNSFRAEYDYIILDCAPSLAVSDALVLSRLADSLLYLVRADATPFQAVEEGVRRLRRANAPVLGVVLNHVQARGRYYYGKYYRYGYRYKYGYYDKTYYHDYYGHEDRV